MQSLDADPERFLPPAPLHGREADRLASLCGLNLPPVGTDPLFDHVARQAAALCGATFGLVSIIGEHEQRYLGNTGFPGEGTPRNEAICAYTILHEEPLVIEDTLLDPRFTHFGGVAGEPHLRFYAGAPILDRSGLPLGTVCVLDTRPHSIAFSRLFTLQRLAAVAGVMLEARRFTLDLLGPNARPDVVDSALTRLDEILGPLFDRANGFRPSEH